MRALAPLLLLLAACSPPSPPGTPLALLPLEVLGPDGTRVDLPLSLSRPAATLKLRVHGLESEAEGHLEVDGGPPIPLDHTRFRIEGPGDPAILAGLGGDTHRDGSPSRPNGGINGEVSVFDLSLPLPLPAGAHRVSFVLDQAPGISAGYRVVRLDLLDAAGHSALAAPLVEEDPGGWTPPLPGAEAAARGKALWEGARLRASFRDPTPLRGHCGSCHAPDGRDLKYFNYSNRAIIVRSRFHGLSQEEGQAVASYIRSLPVYASPYARPWNPPYQPGPGLDTRAVQDWAAGAGLDAVAPDQEVTGRALEESGALATEARLNLRELPIALQLPDWNHWLPRTAPEDLFGDGWTARKASGCLEPRCLTPPEMALEIEKRLEGDPAFIHCRPAGNPQGGLPSEFEVWLARLLLYYQHGGPGLKEGVEGVRQGLEYARWRAVRQWYWMQAYALEDRPEAFHGCFAGAHPERGAPLPPRVEERGWPGSLVFEVGHAIFGQEGTLHTLKATATASVETDQYIMDAWYWLPLLLTPGDGVGAGNVPIDYGYPPGVFVATGRSWYRNLAFSLHGAQERDNGIPPYGADWGDPCGTPGPNTYLATNGWQGWRAGDVLWLFYRQPEQTAGHDLDRVRRLRATYIRSWLNTMRRFPAQSWYRANQYWACQLGRAGIAGPFAGTSRTSVPVQGGPGTDVETMTLRWLIMAAQEGGTDRALLLEVADHMVGLWPCVDWRGAVERPPRDWGTVLLLHGGECP